VLESELRAVVPAQLSLDTFDGEAWLGVMPFRVSGLRLRGLPPVPRISDFLELNVRTYVTVGGKPGIYFLSLDAESRLAVAAARLTYRLPYYRASMDAVRRGDWMEYRSARRNGTREWKGRYRPVGDAFEAEPGSLAHFLAERYRVYVVRRGRVYAADAHHLRWRLRPAEAEIERNTMSPIELRDDPVLHYAERQDVVIWPLASV
jgi:uncharacterized protein YqjF (DUF2071 family)